jgi:hypothetical protein
VNAGVAETAPVYRFWSPVLKSHFYTLDEAEKARLLGQDPNVWTYEGIAFRAFPSRTADGSMPVYRFWSPVLGSHFYTLDEAEKARVLSRYPKVWTYERIAFYAYAAGSGPEGTMPVHRFWSAALGDHFYTISDTDRFKVVSGYAGVWDDEGVAWYAYPPQTAAIPAFTKGPCVQGVTSNSATILWQTDVAAGSEVRYGAGAPDFGDPCLPREDTTPAQAGVSPAETLAARDPAVVTLHRVVLTGLEPGVVYAYRATSGSTSQAGAFRTAPGPNQPFRFVVYGDTRTNADVHRQVAVAIADCGPGIVFHTGDLVGAGGDYGLWDTEFFEPAGGLMRSVPVVPVLGNHEYGGAGPPWFFYFFDRPLKEGWFAMTYGNARMIGLDTNVDYAAGSRQHDWLVQELQSAAYGAAAWRIVIFHHPPFTGTVGHSDDIALQNQLVPLFERYGVDVVFAGHSHAYERYLHEGISYLVTGGGGAPLYELTPGVAAPIRQFGLSVHHYCVVDVDPWAGTLRISAVDLTGQIFDAVTLSKPR